MQALEHAPGAPAVGASGTAAARRVGGESRAAEATDDGAASVSPIEIREGRCPWKRVAEEGMAESMSAEGEEWAAASARGVREPRGEAEMGKAASARGAPSGPRTLIGGEGIASRVPLPCPKGERGPLCTLIGGEGGSTREPPPSAEGARALLVAEGGGENCSGSSSSSGGGGAGCGGGSSGSGGGGADCARARRGVLVASLPVMERGEPSALHVGSADPHCLWAPGEVREPRDRVAATFGLGMLEAAADEELATRAMPIFNTAPETAWREPPTVPIGVPPVVRRIEDVVPVAKLKEVLWWTRRLDRCLRAAERGNVQLARKLRPPDVCMEVAHMVEGTEKWVWDLRPLQEGLPATPLAPSGRGLPPETDLDLEAVRAAGVGFADQGIVSELIHGVSDDNPRGGATVLSPPHEGALRFYAQVLAKLKKDEGRGWSSGGWNLPFWPVRANAYSIVEELRGAVTKHRMVIDLSWPRWEGGVGRALSVNAAIDRSEWPAVGMPRPMQLAEGAAILLSSKGPVKMWGWDGEAYYRKVGRQRAEIHRNCVWVRGGFVVDPREQFGDASAAVKCVRMSGLVAKEVHREMCLVDLWFPPVERWALLWLAQRPPGAQGRSRLGFFAMYVDDGAGSSLDDRLHEAGDGAPVLGIGPDGKGTQEGEWRGRHLRRAEMHYMHSVVALHRLGHYSVESKEQPPDDRLTSLGYAIDLLERRVRLTADKRERYAAEAATLAEASTCPAQQLEELTHKLLYAANVFPIGRQWLHCLFRALKANYRLRKRGGGIVVSKKMRMALRSWVAELKRPGHRGVPLAARRVFPSAGEPGVLVTYSDASGEHGFGAWAWMGGKRVLYTCELWSEHELARHINIKELVAMAASTEAFIERLDGVTHVREFTDNTCAEWAAHGMTPKVEGMQEVMTQRAAALLVNEVYTCVARVATHENVWADWLSRADGEAKFIANAAALGLEVERVPAAEWWRAALRGEGSSDGD